MTKRKRKYPLKTLTVAVDAYVMGEAVEVQYGRHKGKRGHVITSMSGMILVDVNRELYAYNRADIKRVTNGDK